MIIKCTECGEPYDSQTPSCPHCGAEFDYELKKAKNPWTAFWLTFFFGPLGLLYTNVPVAFIMLGIFITMGWFIPAAFPIAWIVVMVMGVTQANGCNKMIGVYRRAA